LAFLLETGFWKDSDMMCIPEEMLGYQRLKI